MHPKRGTFAAALAAGLLTAGAAVSQPIYQKVDTFSGITHYVTKLRNANLEGGSFFSGRYVSFDLNSFSGTEPSYSLSVHTFTGDWIFVKGGASLDLKLNGSELVHLIGAGSLESRRVIDGDLVTENAFYTVTREDLERIGHANTVEFRIYGDRQTITGSVPKEFLADAISFSTLVPATTGATQPTPNTTGDKPLTLGIHFVPLTPKAMAAIHLGSDHGLILIEVDAGSPAAKVGLHKADIILAMNGKPMAKGDDLLAAGVPKTIHIWRGGEELDVAIPRRRQARL